MAPQIANQIKRTCNENGVVFACQFECVIKGLEWISNNNGVGRCQMSGHFRQQRDGNCARLSRLGKNHIVRVRKQHAGNLVHGFIAHCPVNKDDSATGKIALPEFEKFASAGGIVRAVEIYGGLFR